MISPKHLFDMKCGFKLTREQTMEVATARVYNWDIAERRKEKADGKTTEEDDDGKAQPNG